MIAIARMPELLAGVAAWVRQPVRSTAVALGAAIVLGTVCAAPGPAEPFAEPVTKNEKAALSAVHRTAVEIFIDRPGFGVRRLMLPLEDIVKAPKSLTEVTPPDADPAIGPASSVAEPEKPAPKPKQAHFPVQDKFARELGGVLTEDGKERWAVREVQLVGLVTHREPVAYVGGKVPAKKGGKDLPTRELDAFEKAALKAIRGGEDLQAEKRGKSMRMMGPVYAGQRCTACHEEKGQLLGAFSFKLERTPVGPEANTIRARPRQP